MRSFLIALVSFGLGVAVHNWWSDAPGSTTRNDDTRRAEQEESAELAKARAEATKLRGELETLRGETKSEKEEAPAAPDADEPMEGSGEAKAARGPRFIDAKHAEVLRKASWKPAGDALNELMPLLQEANEVAHGRKKMRNELWGDIMKSIGPIINVAVQLETNGVSWSHPVVQLNLLDATLASAGKPLADEQVEAIDPVGQQFIAADARREEEYGATVPAVRKRLDKSLLQGELYAAVEPFLTTEQRAVLWPEGVRGIAALDVFSAASVWDEHLQHMPHAGRVSLRESVTKGLGDHMGLAKESRTMLLQVVTEWEQRYNDAFLLQRPSKPVIGDVKMNPTERVLSAAKAQVKLFESILMRVPLSTEQKKKLVDLDLVYVPLYMAPASPTDEE
ncbi:MAG: hypothetical protein ACYTHK_02610 [Planctomycetota bacterium]|jgi:hypothetical protein